MVVPGSDVVVVSRRVVVVESSVLVEVVLELSGRVMAGAPEPPDPQALTTSAIVNAAASATARNVLFADGVIALSPVRSRRVSDNHTARRRRHGEGTVAAAVRDLSRR